MSITVRVDIVSADHAVMGGEATFVVVPTTMGELGITPRHTQLLAELKAGEVRVTDAKGIVSLFFVSGGVVEVHLMPLPSWRIVRCVKKMRVRS